MCNIEQVRNFKSYDDVKNYFISKQATGMCIGVGLGVCPISLSATRFGWKKYIVIRFVAITADMNDIEPVCVKVPFTPINIEHVLAFYKKAIILETIERFMEIHKYLAPEMDFHKYMTVNFNNMPLTRKDIEERGVVHKFGEYLTLENSHCFTENYDNISSMMDYCGMFNSFTKSHISEIMENALRYSWCVGFSSPVKTGNDAIRRLIFLLNNSCVEITFS